MGAVGGREPPHGDSDVGVLMMASVTNERELAPPLARLLAWVILALIAGAVAYTGWVAVANFSRIGV
jgi:hypothetical protein